MLDNRSLTKALTGFHNLSRLLQSQQAAPSYSTSYAGRYVPQIGVHLRIIIATIIFFVLSGCATKDLLDSNFQNYYIIEVGSKGEYILASKEVNGLDMMEQLPKLVAESGKMKVLLGYKTSPNIQQLLSVYESMKGKNIPIFHINDKDKIVNVCLLDIHTSPVGTDEPEKHFCK